MSEIEPQIVYTPNGLLNVRTDFRDEPEIQDIQLKILEQLAELPGTTVDDDGTLHVEVKSTLGSNFGYARDGSIDNFLADIGKLIPPYPKDGTDRVVNAQWLSPQGFAGAVYPHFQRWLNTQSNLSERVAKETLVAMAVPFGRENEHYAKRDFKMYTQHARAASFELTMYGDEFGVSSSEATDDSHIEKGGKVDWNWVYLSTLGSCACMGVNGDDRQRVSVGADRRKAWLYEITDHNIDFPQQSLSLLLGVGTLAYHAAQYTGREDILVGAEWGEPRAYPKAAPEA